MPTRPCLGCGALTDRPGSRCQPCSSAQQKARDARRGTAHQRGYTSAHDATRQALIEALVPGDLCDRCDQPMQPWQKLDAAHPHDKPLRTHPDSVADHLEHSSCNRGAND